MWKELVKSNLVLIVLMRLLILRGKVNHNLKLLDFQLHQEKKGVVQRVCVTWKKPEFNKQTQATPTPQTCEEIWQLKCTKPIPWTKGIQQELISGSLIAGEERRKCTWNLNLTRHLMNPSWYTQIWSSESVSSATCILRRFRLSKFPSADMNFPVSLFLSLK